MRVVFVGANGNGDSGKGLNSSSDTKTLVNAELLAAREKAFEDVEGLCKR